jgi:hypothetical protein
MIATDRFVFLHLHKSGGTFANECLLRFVPGARRLGYHLPRSLIPRELAHLPALGLVRNPWSYYVSWHAFQSSRAEPNVLYRVLSDGGRLGFEATIRNMLELGVVDTHVDRLIESLPAHYSDRGLNLPGFALAPIRGTGLGFYAFLYRYMYAGAGSTLILGRMENLRSELPGMLAAVGQPVSDAMRDFIERHEPTNVSSHAPYAEYYGTSLRELVAERDRTVITGHGYRFGE